MKARAETKSKAICRNWLIGMRALGETPVVPAVSLTGVLGGDGLKGRGMDWSQGMAASAAQQTEAENITGYG